MINISRNAMIKTKVLKVIRKIKGDTNESIVRIRLFHAMVAITQ